MPAEVTSLAGNVSFLCTKNGNHHRERFPDNNNIYFSLNKGTFMNSIELTNFVLGRWHRTARIY